MKNKLLLTLLMGLVVVAKGQDSTILKLENTTGIQYTIIPGIASNYFGSSNCGTWVKDSLYYTDWLTADTLVKKPITDTVRRWIYNDYEFVFRTNSSNLLLSYCPCGCGYDDRWMQQRVCAVTGIRQYRYRIQTFKYIPKPKSDYEKAVDSLLNKK